MSWWTPNSIESEFVLSTWRLLANVDHPMLLLSQASRGVGRCVVDDAVTQCYGVCFVHLAAVFEQSQLGLSI